ncbi:MAG: hypothetical protein A3J55_02710 [Candidatus Ryanbacteria bacterium RIFCSPHIGHO2_02_FULL_45_17b]|nr:MAG: hypothetical protein A3J55_02710 [Candidatus Ryanbacteria bacterium RIFCSPHIGHO2_02_FULL_45_17b]
MIETLTTYAHTALTVLKVLAIIATIASIAGIVYATKKSREIHHTNKAKHTKEEEQRKSDLDAGISSIALTQLKEHTTQHWQNIIEKLASQQGGKDYKTVIIEADGLVDSALRANQFPGDTMGDRLRNVPPEKIASLNELWKAHRTRNEIAHDPHYVVSPREGHDMMKVYKKVLEELGAL